MAVKWKAMNRGMHWEIEEKWNRVEAFGICDGGIMDEQGRDGKEKGLNFDFYRFPIFTRFSPF